MTLSEAREQARGLIAALLAPQAGAALQQLHSLMGAAPAPDPKPWARPAPTAAPGFAAPTAAAKPAPTPPPSNEGLTLLQVCRAYADHMRAEKKYSASKVSYAAGLRMSEATQLQVRDIDSQRMVLRIEQAKGLRDRYVMLSSRAAGDATPYWKSAKPSSWLLPGIRRLADHSGSRTANVLPRPARRWHSHTRDAALAASCVRHPFAGGRH